MSASLSNAYSSIVALSNTAYSGGFGSGGGGGGSSAGAVDFQRNRIINGNMLLDQRNAGTIVNMTMDGVYYGPDRWKAYISPGVWSSNGYQYTMEQSNVTDTTMNQNGFTKSLKMTCSSNYSFTTRYSRVGLEYTIEGYDIADFNWGASNASSASLSMWMRTNVAGTHWLSLNNNALSLSYVSTFTLPSNVWSNVKLTIPAPPFGSNWEAASNIGIIMNIDMQRLHASSSNFNTWQSVYSVTPSNQPYTLWTTAGNYIELTGVQFEKGSSNTTFEGRSIFKELDFAQRYYEKNIPYDLKPANQTSNADFMYMASNVGSAIIGFKTPKAKVPTVNFYNPYNATGNVTDLTNNVVGGIQSANVTTKGFSTGVTSSSLINKLNYFNWTADAEVDRAYPATAAVGTVQWVASVASPSSDVMSSAYNNITGTADGGVCVTGWYNPGILTPYNANAIAFATTMTTATGVNVFIVKYNSLGNVQWVARVSSPNTQNSYAVCSASDGSIYVVGSWYITTAGNLLTAYNANQTAFGTTLANSETNLYNVFIVKYNSSGTVQWLARVSGAGNDYGNGICSMTDGGVCVTGYYASLSTTLTAYNADTSAFGTTLGNAGNSDTFIVKYNSAGTVQWLARVAGAGTDIGNGICSTNDGGIYVTGYYSSLSTTLTAYNANLTAFGTTLPNSGIEDVFIVKYNATGVVQWVAKVSSTSSDVGRGMCATMDGGICVTGNWSAATLTAFNSNLIPFGTTLAAVANDDAFLVKYNSSGSVQWVAKIAGSGHETGRGITSTSDGGVCVVGDYSSSPLTPYNVNGTSFTTTLVYSGQISVFIIKYTSIGNVNWCARIGSSTVAVTSPNMAICNMQDGSICIATQCNSGIFSAYNADNTPFAVNPYQTGYNFVMLAKYAAVESELTVGPVSGTVRQTQRITGDSTASITPSAVCGTTDGGYCVTGYYTGVSLTAYNPDATTFGTTLGTSTNVSVFIVKYNSSGIVQWIAKVSSGTDATYSIATNVITSTPDGGICITGTFTSAPLVAYNSSGTSFGTTIATNDGIHDTFIVKYNSAGAVQWIAKLSGSSYDVAQGICSASDGSIYVTGHFYSSPMTAYHSTLVAFQTTISMGLAGGVSDVFVVKYDANGTVQWITKMGSSSSAYDIGYSVCPMLDGSICVTGLFASNPLTVYNANTTAFATTLPTSGWWEVMVVKYNSSGVVQWVAKLYCSYTGTSGTVGNFVCGTTDGGICVAGYYRSTLTAYHSTLTSFGTVLTSRGGRDVFLAKYNSSGTVQWVANIGGTGDDEGFSVCNTPDNGICVAGYFASPTLTAYNCDGTAFGTTLVNQGSNDCFIAKYNSFGFVIWLAQIAGSGDDQATGVCTLNDGNIIVTGKYTSSPVTVYNGDKTAFATTLPLAGVQGGFVTKYSAVEINTNVAPPTGRVQWVARVSGAGNDYGNGICSTNDGGICVTGYYTSSTLTAYNADTSAFGTTLTLTTSADAFVVKYSSVGTVQWVANIGGTANEIANGICATTDGGICITGQYTSTTLTAYNANNTAFATTLTNSSAGITDIFVVKYSSAGTVQWVATICGTSSDDVGYAVCGTIDGGICVTGYYYSSTLTAYNATGTAFGTTLANSGSSDVYIVKYNSIGTVQWVARVAGTSDDAGYSICSTSDGGICVTGYSYNGGALTAYNANLSAFGTTFTVASYDGFLVKYNSAGTVQWLARISGTSVDQGQGVCSTSDGGICVSGYYAVSLLTNVLTVYNADGTTFGTTLVNSNTGMYDAFVAKYNSLGTVQWVARVGGASNDYGKSMCRTSDGGVCLASYSTSGPVTAYNADTTTFGTTLANAGGNDAFIVKYSSSGFVMWIARVAGSSGDNYNSVCSTSDGGIAVAGSYSSNPLSLYNSDGTMAKTLTNAGSSDAFIVKYY